jgi:hypothetical protein
MGHKHCTFKNHKEVQEVGYLICLEYTTDRVMDDIGVE